MKNRIFIFIIAVIFFSGYPFHGYSMDGPFKRKKHRVQYRKTKEKKITEDEKIQPSQVSPRGAALGKYLTAIYLKNKGRIPEAISNFKAAALYYNDNFSVLYPLSELLFIEGKNQAALATLKNIKTPTAREQTDIDYLYGRLYLEENLADSSVIFLSNIPRDASAYENAQYWLGMISSRKGKNQEAVNHYINALNKNPRMLSVYYDLGAAYIRMEKYSDAASAFKNILILSPFNLSAHLSLAMIDEYLNLTDEARKHYQAVWLIDEKHTIAPLKLAGISFNEKDDTRAFLILNTATEIQKNNISFLYDAADLLENKKHDDEAFNIYKKILLLDPEQVKAHIEVGTIYLKKNQLKESIVHLNRALRLDPGNLGLVVSLGYLYFKTEQVMKTKKLLFETVNHFVKTDSSTIQGSYSGKTYNEFRKQIINLLYYTGMILDQNKNYNDALACFEKILMMDNKNARAMNYIGYTLAEKGVKLDRARKLITSALNIEPDNGYFIDSMGWLLYREGNFDGALAKLLKAKKLAGDNDVIFEHLGDVYSEKKMYKEAVRYWNMSLKINNSNKQLIQKIKRVQSQLDK